MEKLVHYSCSSPGCQFSSTATRRRRNQILFRQREKQVALKPAEGCIRFRPRLLFMSASRIIKTAISSFQVCTAVIRGQLEWRNFVFTRIQQHVWPIRFDYHVSTCSLLLLYPLTVFNVIFRILRALCRRVKADSHITCRAHAVLWQCRSSQGHGTARPSIDGLWATCPRSASSGYHAEFTKIVIRSIPVLTTIHTYDSKEWQ